jgi:hypothetical protein
MSPQFGAAESIHSPGAVCTGLFQDLGWTMTNIPSPAPANDNCINAAVFPTLSTNQICTNLQGNTDGATPSLAPCVGTGNNDVWFSFVAVSTKINIKIALITSYPTYSGNTNLVHEMFSGDCSNLTSMGCSDPDESWKTGLTIGTTYYIRVYNYAIGTSSNFSICLRVPPINDDCVDATIFPTILNNQTNICLSGNTSGAGGQLSACTGSGTNDVWFSFIAPSNSVITTVTSQGDMVHQIYSGGCGNLTNLKCSDPPSSQTTGLIAGNTYYVRVYNYYTSFSGSFDICIRSAVPIPSNDNCSGAIAFPSIPTNQTCVTLQGNTESATLSQAVCTGYGANDVWFSFVAPATTMVTQITTISGSGDRVHQLFSGTCGNLTSIKCSNPETSITTGLIVGNTYYIRVYSYLSSFNDAFNICLKTQITNDDCSGATPFPTIPSNQTCVSLSGNTATATSSLAACAGYTGGDVWFSFVAPTSSIITELSYISGGGTDMVHQLFSGTCGNLTSIKCSDPETSQTDGLIVGETYYIRVYSYYYFYTSNFNICLKAIPPPPSNDHIANAITLTVGATCSGNTYTNTGATTETGEQAPPCATSYGASVWFKFIAPPSGTVVLTTDIGTPTVTNGDGILSVFAGNPNNLATMTQIACDEDGGVITDFMPVLGLSLNAGETYYARFSGFLNNGVATAGNFCIEARDGSNTVPFTANCGTTYTASNASGYQFIHLQNTLIPTEFVIAINPNGNNLGTITANMNTSNTVQVSNGEPYLARNYAITSTISPVYPVKVRIYFNDTEFNALSAAVNGPATLSQCAITHVPGTACSSIFSTVGASGAPSLITPTAAVNLVGTTSFIEFETNSFSSFYVNKNAAVLPIELLSFTAEAINKQRLISWITTAERNVKSFELHRSSDGISFETIHSILAEGNTKDSRTDYYYNDAALIFSKTVYYRLKIINEDATFSFSNIVFLEQDNNKKELISIYPNPVEDKLTLKLDTSVEKARVIVYDNLGRKVYHTTIADSIKTIATTSWQTGVYSILVLFDNGTQSMSRVVKN